MFPPSFFDHLEDRLNLAVYDINEIYRVEHGRPNSKPHLEVQGYASPAEPLETEIKIIVASTSISRLKNKLNKAAGVAGRAVAAIEGQADALIAQEGEIQAKTESAFAPHKAILAEATVELKAIEDALNLMSNGGPALDPLPGSGTVEPS